MDNKNQTKSSQREDTTNKDGKNLINLEVLVPDELGGDRFDKVAAQLFTDFSRAELSRWIQNGNLTANDEQLKPRTKLLGGERLNLDAQLVAQTNWHKAQPITLDIVYEDEEILVLNKPAGLVVHPGAGNPDQTLVNGLLAYRPGLDQIPRAGIVHRLDKDTSGLMLVATSLKAHKELVAMIQAREIQRRYHGVCEGRMVAGQNVDSPIGRDAKHRTRQAVREDGKPAYTEFRVEQRFRVHTLVEAKLGTGRTHQIRVHLKSIGYPLVGDKQYGARGKLPVAAQAQTISTLREFGRQALHAYSLEFQHPVADEWMSFEAPWPEDFAKLVGCLKEDLENAI